MSDLKERAEAYLALAEVVDSFEAERNHMFGIGLGCGLEWERREANAQEVLVEATDKAVAIIRDQQAEIERLRKDAERYQWLRAQHQKHLGLTICEVNMYDLAPWSGDDLDTAIDAAMSLERSNG